MNWSNIRLIVVREIRDQLRDRRTMFMVAVLPVLLYPLMGMSFLQLTQFMHEREIRVLVLGAPTNAELPPLVENGRFSETLYPSPLLHLTLESSDLAHQNPRPSPAQARREMLSGNYELVVYFPPDFSDQFARYRQAMLHDATQAKSTSELQIPNLTVYPNLAKETSRTAYDLVGNVLDHWRDQIGQNNLKEGHVSQSAASPFDIATLDLAKQGQHDAAIWSKILPFLVLIWALTGAFYPAIDLCAGEKERGTLETLLCCPAERIEIVWGKLLTVMLFSMATAVLNLASISVSGSLVVRHMPDLGPPPGQSMIWLLVALVPVSALFSALCLALGALARSTKEGQYYLMPLILVTTPLTVLPMAPGVELGIVNSLIPLTGVVLVLRTIIEGNVVDAWPYIPLVTAVTLGCCWLAIRWAVTLFNAESILFRDAELWNLRQWLGHLLREQKNTPNWARAVVYSVLIVVIGFFVQFGG